MNNCIILKHYKTGSGVFNEERCFHDIIDPKGGLRIPALLLYLNTWYTSAGPEQKSR